MAPISTVTDLPNEILDQILGYSDLQMIDVMNFAFTCKRFYWAVTNCNKLWNVKFFQRWPSLQGIFENKRLVWFEEIKMKMKCCRKLIQKLDTMLTKHNRKMELGPYDLTEFDELFRPECGADPMNYHYLVNELIQLKSQPIGQGNLTHKFYATYVLNYLRQTYLANEWKEMTALPENRQLMERGAFLVDQWNQPQKPLCVGTMLTILDELAAETKALVAERYPENDLNSATPEELAKWKVENLCDNVWSSEDSRAIVMCLCEIIFRKYAFTGAVSPAIPISICSFFNQLLTFGRGTPVLMAILIESVARRLGIRCEYVCVADVCLLRWKERYQVDEGEELECFYFDVINQQDLMTKERWKRTAMRNYPMEHFNQQESMSVTEVVCLMANNILQATEKSQELNGRTVRMMNILHLIHLVNPKSYTNVFALISFYTLHEMDISEYIESFRNVLTEGSYQEEYVKSQVEVFVNGETIRKKRLKEELSRPPIPKKRTIDVKYAVGMIMKNPARKLCVIVGWDTKLKEECKFKIHAMPNSHVLSLPPQPYYHVYNDDGSCEYLPQEQLFLSPSPNCVNHHEIGRHFYKYMGTYYMPNESKAREYPEDLEVLEQLRVIDQHVTRITAS